MINVWSDCISDDVVVAYFSLEILLCLCKIKSEGDFLKGSLELHFFFIWAVLSSSHMSDVYKQYY